MRLWDVESGGLLQTLQHSAAVVCVAWSPDGALLATGGGRNEKRVSLWEAATGRQRVVLGAQTVNSIAWSPAGDKLATCSDDRTVLLWDVKKEYLLHELQGHRSEVRDVSWSPDGRWLCSGSLDKTLRLWDAETGEATQTLTGQRDFCLCVDWSPTEQQIASGSHDRTVSIWDLNTGYQKYLLEGHTGPIVSVAYLDAGRLLASIGQTGAVIVWRTDTWAEVMRVDRIGDASLLANIATHPTLQVMAARGSSSREINIWDLDLALLRGTEGAEPAAPTVYYVNAKAVLLGDSGVGKSGLGIRLAEGEYRPTEGSTHGAQFWHFPIEGLGELPDNIQAELTLWDLAGQPDYRLTHQLFLDDTDAALLLFDCSDPTDPFHGVRYWAKVLKKLAPKHAVKYLVAARCDVSPVTVDRPEINHALDQYGVHEYFKTSAKEGEGIEALFESLKSSIPWTRLPRTSTPKLFQALRELLLERKESGETLLSMDAFWQAAKESLPERAIKREEIDTVIALLQSRGLTFRLEPRPGVTRVLLKPELVNQYGASIIQAARSQPLGIGAVSERNVLVGALAFSGFVRLPRAEEVLVLEATTELLIRRGLGFREMGYLVFPSQINVTRLPPGEAHPRTEVAYRFSGSIETIYASLVVRLSYTDYFRREEQWKYAVEFSRSGSRLGFSMQQVKEGTGELEIYFHPGVSGFDRVTFIRFVTDHLKTKGVDIEEQIRLYCPKCSKEVTNLDAIDSRIKAKELDIPCQYCSTAIVIPKSIEERYRREPALVEKQQELAETVARRTEEEVEQLRQDQRQYTDTKDSRIHILHLSDLHLENADLANIYRTQLETDLIRELEIRRLQYLVISGDVAHLATEEEYRAAFEMVDSLVKRFGLDASRVVIVPGNHDVNWPLSKEAYPFVYRDDLPSPLTEDSHIPAGDAGALVCDKDLYRKRFAPFNDHFYRRVYSGQGYPLDEADQALIVEKPEDRILFLGLNSCWQLDHHFRERASINMLALTRALDRLQEEAYDGWLKIAVWHHPVTGVQMMNDEFMELLSTSGFRICLHGHIHEAIEDFYKYDNRHGLHIVGAGTFGAPAREQVTGIPLQYNLLSFDPNKSVITVQTRKKEKPNGAWSADARWGDKRAPVSYYRIHI